MSIIEALTFILSVGRLTVDAVAIGRSAGRSIDDAVADSLRFAPLCCARPRTRLQTTYDYVRMLTSDEMIPCARPSVSVGLPEKL